MERTGVEQWKPREVARLLALVETERRYYQEMMAALPAALVVLAHDRTILTANMAFRRLVGLSGEELRKRSIEQILPSEELIEHIRSAHVDGGTVPFSINMGDRRFRMSAAPIRGWEDDLEPETLLLVEQVATGEAVASPPALTPEPSTPEPSLDVSVLPAAVWQADASTFVFTYAGGAAQELLGYAAAHWRENPLFFWERIHPEDRGEIMELYQSVAAIGGEASAEYRAMHASGIPVWCRETIRVPAPGEGARSIAGVMSAIGERRQIEAQSLAAARVDALRGLSSRLAHDLNNPLMVVTGYGEELLNALPEGDPLREDLAEILAAGGRLAEVAGRLLGFTRAQAHAPSKIELSELLANLTPKLREICDAGRDGIDAGIDMEVASRDGAVWTLADPGQLADAIAALSSFAMENTRDASRLAVTCGISRLMERADGATLKAGLHARIGIRAYGVGTGSAIGVFELILPAKDANKPAGPEVARAYLNVRQWGGDIAFSSSETFGSEFTVYLPYAEPPYVEPPEEAPAPAPEAVAAEPVQEPAVEPAPVQIPLPEPSMGTVLVVEDEPGIRGLVRKILKRERFEVLEAGSGEEALTAASEADDEIGLLLTDVMLPGMGGRELADTLLALHPGLRVVYISGFTDDESVRVGQFPPGSKFLQKPFTLSALVGVVKAAFQL